MKQKQTRLYCFSPPVMLATFAIEIILFAYVLIRYKMNRTTRLAAALLFFLATFQLAEYYVCGGLGWDAANWSRLGYVAITMLPPLGLHLMYTIARKPTSRLVWAAYATGLAWSGLFIMGSQVFSGYQCTGNYVIFQLRETIGGMYMFYYYGWLLTTILMAYKFSKTATAKVRRALSGLVVGYGLFMIPTAVVNTVAPATIDGIPSIMCGFAVLFAIVLVWHVLPLTVANPKPARRRVR